MDWFAEKSLPTYFLTPLPPPDASGQTLDFLKTMAESLKYFDKEHIHLAAFRSSNSSKAVEVDGSLYAQIPRESVYDTELMRILSNWLQSRHGWTVTGQWHLKNPFGRYKYTLYQAYDARPGHLIEVK